MLEALAGSDDEADRHALRERLLAESLRTSVGIGRALLRYRDAADALRAQRDMLLGEYEQALEPLERRIAEAEAILGDIALLHREQGHGNSLTIPGVGVWATRLSPERWKIKNEAAIAGITNDDDRARFVERSTTIVEKLRRDAFIAHLEEAIATLVADRPWPEDTEQVRLTLEELKRSVAEQNPGVEWIPPAINVKYELRRTL